ncbi:ABC transporter permease [Clostridium estertheticum]|uniref:ABC transporter permease n=1 Tax=Clostridium estertheticum TaxID=238834 RepID=UPI001C6DFC47|nr:ABC transporter permease [Clostridium estertheticum]MBW9154577.1 ABC transporter permease [Clostridium estertheticum]WLC83818.1 ABC transporter permease [Clostridium estertheticum]
MKILYISFKDLLITLKDKKAMALIVLMPVVLIFVLGLGLSGTFKNTAVTINKFDVAIADKDNGKYSIQFKDLLKSKEVCQMINFKEISEASGKNNVKNGQLPVLVVIPKGYSQNIEAGKKTNMEIYSDPGNPIDTKTIESFVKSYTGTVSSIQAAVEASDKQLNTYKLNSNMIVSKLVSQTKEQASTLSESSLKSKDSLSAMQYYSAAMLAMYILFVGSLGTSSMLEEREDGTLSKLFTTTASKFEILSGKLLGVFFLGIFDVIILIFFTKLAFNVSWGISLLGLIVLSLSMIFASCGFSMFLSVIFKTSKSASLTSSVIIMIMAFIGGSMYPLSQMPAIMQTVSKFMLNNWALRGYLSLMMGGGFSSIITPSIVLLVIGILLLLCGTLKFKFE